MVAIRTGTAPGGDHRDRLIAAMGELLAEQGYASVTVTGIVSRARVSKRTFYQHFSDREECLLATYRVVAEAPLHRIAEAADVRPSGPGCRCARRSRWSPGPTSRRWPSTRC